MKVIGVVVAMDRELELFREITKNAYEEKKSGGFRFLIVPFDDTILVTASSGIGKVNSALCVATMINEYHPKMVISSGVCAAVSYYADRIKTSDIIISNSVSYHDVWCGEPNKKGQIQGMPYEFRSFELNEQLLNKIKDSYKGHEIYVMKIFSGDYFIENKQQVTKIMSDSTYSDFGIDMESGSIAQTCHIYSVPFLSVRIVSDCPCSETNKTYEEFWADAPKELNDIVSFIIKNID